jgi:hypothetical protein
MVVLGNCCAHYHYSGFGFGYFLWNAEEVSKVGFFVLTRRFCESGMLMMLQDQTSGHWSLIAHCGMGIKRWRMYAVLRSLLLD